MTLWFVADTHYGHEAVIRFGNRPWGSVDEMNEGLVEAWNAVVSPRDEVWHLGDVSFIGATALDFLRRVNGRVHVCFGNHDSRKELIDLELNEWVESIQHVKYLRWQKRRFWLSHYAHRVWPNSNAGSFHLFGHSHGDMDIGGGRLMDVGVDATAKRIGNWRTPRARDYRPVSFDEVVSALKNRAPTDHHKPTQRSEAR